MSSNTVQAFGIVTIYPQYNNNMIVIVKKKTLALINHVDNVDLCVLQEGRKEEKREGGKVREGRRKQ
jgi:hypothetical protein